MFVKKGKIFNDPKAETNETDERFLQSDEGKVYKVSEAVVFVWDKLNGETKLDEINTEIQRIANVKPEEIKDFSQNIVKQLQTVDLVSEV